MTGYIIRRILFLIPTVLVISIIAFILMELPPGDFLTSYILQLESSGAQVSEAQIAALRARYGLDEPAYKRYFLWISGIVTRGDFGRSWNWNRPVVELIIERLPYTLVVSLVTMTFQYLVAIPIGIYSAVKRHSLFDYTFTTIGFLGLSVPSFILALILMFFAYTTFGTSIGGLFSAAYREAPWSFAKFVDLLKHIWIPMVVTGMSGSASLIRIMRGVMLDELGKDYIRTARSKGLRERVVIVKHAVRIAINPILSSVTWVLPQVISGGAITAIVLNLPTLGPLLLQSLITQDMFVAGGIILLLSTLTVIGSFISDLLLAWADPRITYD
ncbi:MAG: ABC transporter permease [Limnochordia bacterium]|jgi:peptide/nickel transport system permease protein|nr:ABC transporter permease [Bacillota bacterium]NLL07654.1 ABC transporter permease [Bacillota bacterium]HBG10301.1 ABC transporter permease [Bacillota bacterium]